MATQEHEKHHMSRRNRADSLIIRLCYNASIHAHNYITVAINNHADLHAYSQHLSSHMLIVPGNYTFM